LQKIAALTSYRGDEAIDCVGMQPVVEPDLGLCDNLKPNRFFRTERKRFIRTLHQQGLFIFKGISTHGSFKAICIRLAGNN
jgi:predicted aldo/keto reductase-like oxidoreductase